MWTEAHRARHEARLKDMVTVSTVSTVGAVARWLERADPPRSPRRTPLHRIVAALAWHLRVGGPWRALPGDADRRSPASAHQSSQPPANAGTSHRRCATGKPPGSARHGPPTRKCQASAATIQRNGVRRGERGDRSLQPARYLAHCTHSHHVFQARLMPRPMRLGPHPLPHLPPCQADQCDPMEYRWDRGAKAHSNRL